MSDLKPKLIEIERNIHESQTMLAVLRSLPESEETNAQIHRFQELTLQLEEFRNRYKALETSSVTDIDSQLEALWDKHERIKMLLEKSTTGTSLTFIQNSNAITPEQNLSRIPAQSRIHQTSATEDEIEDDKSEDSLYDIEPSEYPLHYQAQTTQLESMLSEISHFQEIVGRISGLVVNLKMTETVSHLSDVGQRFTEIHLKLIDLQNSYEALYNHQNPSHEFKAARLKCLREFLISVGRNLEATKDVFFSIASAVKNALGGDNDDNNTSQGETSNGPSGELTPPDRTQATAPKSTDKSNHIDDQRCVELVLSDLDKQRDELLTQLTDLHLHTFDGTMATSNCEHNNLPRSTSTELTTDVDCRRATDLNLSFEASDEIAAHSLPILKQLLARKEQLEELRGELQSFSFPDDGNLAATKPLLPGKGSQGKTFLKDPFSGLHSAASGAGVSSSGTVGDSDISTRSSSSPRRVPRAVTPVERSDAAELNSEQSEVASMNNTECLYKTIREARIALEEHRNVLTVNEALENGDKAIVGRGLRNVTTSAPSESTSYMDATAAATWGGDSECEDFADGANEGAAGSAFMTDAHTSAGSKPSHPNQRFLISKNCSVGREIIHGKSLAVQTHLSHATDHINLPHLGLSPSPCAYVDGSSGMAFNITSPGEQHPQVSPVLLPSRPEKGVNTANFNSFEECAFSKPLAAKLAVLEFKVEQLTQTCQLLVTGNARLNSVVSVLLANQRHPSMCTSVADWSVVSCGAPMFVSPHAPSIPKTASLFASPIPKIQPPVLPPVSTVGVSSVHSLTPAPLTPTAQMQNSPSLEKTLDQVHILTGQVMEQHARVNQLQHDLRTALENYHQQQNLFTAGGDSVMGISRLVPPVGPLGYQLPQPIETVIGSHQASRLMHPQYLDSVLALQQTAADIATDLQSLQSFIPTASETHRPLSKQQQSSSASHL